MSFPLVEDETIFVRGIKYVSYLVIVRHSGAVMMKEVQLSIEISQSKSAPEQCGKDNISHRNLHILWTKL